MQFENALKALERGQKYLVSGQHGAADELVIAALEQFPEDGGLLQLQGMIWHAMRRYASARQAFELASLLVPLSLAAQLTLADTYRRCQQRSAAQTILSYLATRNDVPTSLLPPLTAGLGAIGEYQLALETCREASRREPDSDEALFGMAYYMNKLDYPVECVLPLLRTAVSLDPACRMYRMGLATTCVRARLWNEAYDLFCEVSPEQVKCASCLNVMIRVFDRIGDHPRRDGCLSRVLELSNPAMEQVVDSAASSESLRETE